MNIYEKLTELQNELKAPKNQYNSFGKYKYRSCEDILEGVKPLLKKYKLALYINDAIIERSGRYYLIALGRLINIEKPEEKIEVEGIAREEESKKGMDGSQVTGASSSYARKYMLNGLFAIDDTKDSDGTNLGAEPDPAQQNKKPNKTVQPKKTTPSIKTPELEKLTADQVKTLHTLADEAKIKSIKEFYKIESIKDLTKDIANGLIKGLMEGK